jgi:hypothetical protein
MTLVEAGERIEKEKRYLHLSYPRPGPLFSFSERVDY